MRKWLVTSLLTVTVLVWGIAGFFSYRDARNEVQELFDAQLGDAARTLLTQIQSDPDRTSNRSDRNRQNEDDDENHEDHEKHGKHSESEEIEHFGHRYSQSLLYQVWTASPISSDKRPISDRLLIDSTKGLKVDRLAPESTDPSSKSESGYSTRIIDGQSFRVFSLWDANHQYQIQVAQKAERRETFSNHVALHILMPILFALPILAFLIQWAVNRALIPLQKTASDVATLGPEHLDPIPVIHCPAETLPLVHAINDLLTRLGAELEKERRFTADASHELRTPLSAIKAQAEVALNAESESERQNALLQLDRAVDRSSHLITQLLTLARLDPGSTLVDCETVDLRLLAKEVVSELAPFAVEKRIDLGFHTLKSNPSDKAGFSTEINTIFGNRSMLTVMFRNLIDNAIRYTPPEGHVNVLIRSTDDGKIIEVQNTGPGVTPENQNRLFDRFFRASGTDQEGSGLGLSIVKKVVELHKGKIELDGPPGFIIRVLLHSVNV